LLRKALHLIRKVLCIGRHIHHTNHIQLSPEETLVADGLNSSEIRTAKNDELFGIAP